MITQIISPQLIGWMNDLGPLANLIAVLSFIGTMFIFTRWIVRLLFKKNIPSSIESWALDKFGSSGTSISAKCRKSIKIAIVDDEPGNIASQLLANLGYKVSIYTSISLAAIDELLSYDLVILDITNVVPEDPKKGGMLIIKTLKSALKPPLVIAVSGKRYDPSTTEFFKLADLALKKPVQADKLSSAVNDILTPLFSLHGVAKSLDTAISMNGLQSQGDVLKINHLVIKEVQEKTKKKPLIFSTNKIVNERIIDLTDRFKFIRKNDGNKETP
ncbi:response regulator [Polynucleobacter sp. Fuers-14]|uniref:response regulator n=1 Tax=Polynucleobacter sp. Fuers-14 TaxID=1758364 RepID=UPI001C0AF84E|nr:response regulator [Polynucleobacter sp. Fuers-14]MBU3641683.1 response regulator [Polynucleobacter sp. Fuers-14]